MRKNEAFEILKIVGGAFPGSIPADDKTLLTWAEVLEDVDAKAGAAAAKRMTRELETIYPGSNLGAMIRNRAKPTLTAATVENHLHSAVQMNQSVSGRPYEYLRGIDSRLLDIAENADLFDRTLSAQDLGFRVRDVAKRYMEERENRKKGFSPPKIDNDTKQLPPPQEITEAQMQLNRDRVKRITAMIGQKSANT